MSGILSLLCDSAVDGLLVPENGFQVYVAYREYRYKADIVSKNIEFR